MQRRLSLSPFQAIVGAMAAISEAHAREDMSPRRSLGLEPMLPPTPPPPIFVGYAIKDDRGQFWNGSKWVPVFEPRTCLLSAEKAANIARVLIGRYKHTKRHIGVHGVTVGEKP